MVLGTHTHTHIYIPDDSEISIEKKYFGFNKFRNASVRYICSSHET